MRYPISDTATNEVPPNTSTGATGVATLHSITSGRVFWVRGVRMQTTSTSGVVEIYDATAQTTATGQTIRLVLPSATFHADIAEAVINFPAPGIKFSNSYVLAKLAASGSIASRGMSVVGWEE